MGVPPPASVPVNAAARRRFAVGDCECRRSGGADPGSETVRWWPPAGKRLHSPRHRGTPAEPETPIPIDTPVHSGPPCSVHSPASPASRGSGSAARKLGMEAHIQLEDRVADGDETYRSSGNLLLDLVLGAVLHTLSVGEDEAAADAAMERRAGALAAEGRKPYVIHSAPGHAPLGGLGYVLAAEEIVDQAPRMRFDAVVCASGSALTHAGLLAGLRASSRR